MPSWAAAMVMATKSRKAAAMTVDLFPLDFPGQFARAHKVSLLGSLVGLESGHQ
jgi:hypothetical protein